MHQSGLHTPALSCVRVQDGETVHAHVRAYRAHSRAFASLQVMFYLVNPNGEFVDYYGANLSAADIAARIGSEMRAFG